MDREGLLDALTVLYDECNTDSLKKSDKYIANFVDKFRHSISDLRKLRVNSSDFEVRNVIGRGHFGVVHVSLVIKYGDKVLIEVYILGCARKTNGWYLCNEDTTQIW